jgi:SOS regulatory protein LexA
VLGLVEAGWPSPAEEELLDTITLDEYLIPNHEATFIARVKGDSMMDAGIMPGDQVLVQRGLEPKNGDIVIATLDNQTTIKRYKKVGKQVILMPENKRYGPIVPQEGQELVVNGVVVSLIRKYSA